MSSTTRRDAQPSAADGATIRLVIDFAFTKTASGMAVTECSADVGATFWPPAASPNRSRGIRAPSDWSQRSPISWTGDPDTTARRRVTSPTCGTSATPPGYRGSFARATSRSGEPRQRARPAGGLVAGPVASHQVARVVLGRRNDLAGDLCPCRQPLAHAPDDLSPAEIPLDAIPAPELLRHDSSFSLGYERINPGQRAGAPTPPT